MRDREMGNDSYMGDAMEVSVPDILSAGGSVTYADVTGSSD